MRYLILFVFVLLLFVFVLPLFGALFESHTFTGAGGDNRWDNPANWSRGVVPGPGEDVHIAPTTICVIENPVSVASFSNHGTVESPSGGSLTISATNTFQNAGNLTAGGELSISSGYYLANSGTIWSGKDMRIAGRDISNEGSIEAGPGADDNGANIDIKGDVVNNHGNIAGGSGESGGGDVNIVAREVYNEGQIQAGSGALVGSPNGDLNIYSDCLDNEGLLRGGGYESDKLIRERALVGHPYGNITIIADSVEIHPASDTSRIETVDTLRIICRKLRVYDLYSTSISTESCALIYNTTDGYANFSGASVTFAITSDGHTSIFSNNYTPPPMEFVFWPAPDISTPDTMIVGGVIASDFACIQAGETDSLNITLQNQSTASKVLNYSINSTKGWLSPLSANTGLILPFQFSELRPNFSIPSGTIEGSEDTVIAILTIAPGFADTTYSRIFCISTPVKVKENGPRLPEALTISAWPNPFNSSVSITAPVGAEIEVFDVNGRRVSVIARPKAAAISSNQRDCFDGRSPSRNDAKDEFIWTPNENTTSGVYLVRAVTEDKAVSKRVVYLK